MTISLLLGTLQRYLGALGYSIEISVIDNRIGNVAGKTTLSLAKRKQRPVQAFCYVHFFPVINVAPGVSKR